MKGSTSRSSASDRTYEKLVRLSTLTEWGIVQDSSVSLSIRSSVLFLKIDVPLPSIAIIMLSVGIKVSSISLFSCVAGWFSGKNDSRSGSNVKY